MKHVLKEGENEYILDSSAMVGQIGLLVNGQRAMKSGKKTFWLTNDDGSTIVYKLVGSDLNGLTLVTPESNIVVTRKLNVLEMILILLPLLSTFIGIIVGDVVGGFFGALFGIIGLVINAKVVRSQLNSSTKVLVCLMVIAAATVAMLLMCLVLLLGLYAFLYLTFR